MTTNAQAALQAAATVYSGGRGHTAPEHVKGMAAAFKLWLDNQDRAGARVVEEQAQPRPHSIGQTWLKAKPSLPPDGTVPGR